MPAQKKPRTQPITRVRTGCFTCRRRKKRCDEERPICNGCRRNRLLCSWPTLIATSSRACDQPQRHSNATPPSAEAHRVESSIAEGLNAESFPTEVFQVESPIASSQSSFSPSSSTSSASISDQETGSPADMNQLQDAAADEWPRRRFSVPEGTAGQELVRRRKSEPEGQITQSPSLLAGYDAESYELLSHYLSSTADCMANGSNPINPFLVQIIPLAFSNDLLFQLVLTQSAVHRAFRSQKDSDAVAQVQYTKALRRFRGGISRFIGEAEAGPLMLTLGALLMCFTETARGDVNGIIFDHLAAANSLLSGLISRSNMIVPRELGDFIVEYYIYTASVSMIAVDTKSNSQFPLGFELERYAQQLTTRQYVGNLCGCWLDLLLLIPSIASWGRQWVAGDNASVVVAADDFAVFGSLQAQILRWSPFSWVSPEVSLAGLIFQRAMLLYLYTAASCLPRVESGMYQVMIDTAAAEAMSYFQQLSASARINSGLCWPIAVVGSCLRDLQQQDQLRYRLNAMVSTFGLGNMHRTLLLLEHMWQMAPDESSPWSISRAMREHQMRFSFA